MSRKGIERRENGRRLTRSLGHREGVRAKRQADEVVGMDVLGDTLAVLVVRDAGGVIPERRVDWYDISGVTDTAQ